MARNGNGSNGDVVKALAAFRRQLAQDLAPEPWAEVRAPLAVVLADVAEALGVPARRLGEVLGREGMAALRRVHRSRARLREWEMAIPAGEPSQ
jgi:hypothetical protein